MAQAKQRQIRVPVPSSGVDSSGEISRLRTLVSELERQVGALNDSVVSQRSCLMDGYIVNVRPDVDGGYVAHCPTLHAVSEGDSLEDAVASIRDAMAVSIEGREHFGRPIPAKDTETACQD